MSGAVSGLPPAMTPAAVARAVRPGSRIWLGSASATPRHILAALEALPAPPPDVELVSYLASRPDGLPESRYRHRVFFVTSEQRDPVAEGRADHCRSRSSSSPGCSRPAGCGSISRCCR